VQGVGGIAVTFYRHTRTLQAHICKAPQSINNTDATVVSSVTSLVSEGIHVCDDDNACTTLTSVCMSMNTINAPLYTDALHALSL
jgi:hypothetical protein